MPAGTLIPELAAPPALTLKSNNSVSPGMCLKLFEQLHLLWSLGYMFVSESVVGPFKRKGTLVYSSPLSRPD